MLARLLSPVRAFSAAAPRRDSIPWFVDPAPVTRSFDHRPHPPHLPRPTATAPPVPDDAPHVLRHRHSKLLESPHLDTTHLVVSPAVLPADGPPLPLRVPHGRRNRGGTYAGESAYDDTGAGIWSWVITAQASNYYFFYSICSALMHGL